MCALFELVNLPLLIHPAVHVRYIGYHCPPDIFPGIASWHYFVEEANEANQHRFVHLQAKLRCFAPKRFTFWAVPARSVLIGPVPTLVLLPVNPFE